MSPSVIRRPNRLACGIVPAFLVGSCVGSALWPQLANAEEPNASNIHNGEAVETCGFAPVVSLSGDGGGCTGTLVHSRLVIMAAHCGTQFERVGFGNEMDWGADLKPDRFVATKRCVVNPAYNSASDQHLDFAFCELAEEVTDLPVVPPAFGCEYEAVFEKGQAVVQCGFGATAGSGQNVSGVGTKLWADNQVASIDGAGRIGVGPPSSGAVACPGDSGGPLLVQLEDMTWRTMGITSTYSGSCSPGNTNTYAPMREAVKWIESASGIDITPCFDSDGTWNPTEDCGGFFAGGPGAAGAWDSWCMETPRGGLSETCGEPFHPADTEAPSVAISEPLDGAEFESEDGSVTVDVVAEVDDGAMGSGIKEVKLRVDGEDVSGSELTGEPWQWSQKLDDGEHTLEVVAVDNADNEAVSDKVEVTVTPPEEETSTPEESSTSEEESSAEEESSSSGDDDDDDSTSQSDTDSQDDSASDDDDDSESAQESSDDEGSDDDEDETSPDEDANSSSGCRQSSAAGWVAWLAAGLFLPWFARRRRAS
jgi:hypothetical protein